MARGILYSRVSTDEQNKGSSPEEQIRRGAEYTQQHGITVVAELRDDYSGYSFERPAFDQVRAMLASGQADTLICLSGDRLARSVFVVGRIVEEVLRRYRVDLHFVSRGRIDYDSPEGEFIMLLEAVGNQYWGNKSKEVMRNGRRALVSAGIKPGQGPTLYGFVKVGDRRETRYEIDPLPADVIRRIFTEVAAGKAIVAIARDLTSDGILIPSQVANMKRDKLKDYGIWTPKILHRIIKNEAYAGTLWLNRTSGTYGKDLRANTREAWIPVSMPTIVDRALWQAAQEALADHVSVRRDGGAHRHTFLMAGLVRCACCAERGRPGMHAVTPSPRASKGRTYYYYICTRSLLPYLSKEERCPLPSISRDKLDRAVWRFIEELYNDPDAILASFQEAQLARRLTNKAVEERIRDLEHTIGVQRSKQENLWEEVASLPRTATNARTSLHNVINRLDEAIVEGEGQVSALRATLVSIPDDEALTTILSYQVQLHEGLRVADTVEKRRAVIDALNMTVSVNVTDGKVSALLHWWGSDVPLSLEDDDSSGGSFQPIDSDPSDPEVVSDIPTLRTVGHMKTSLYSIDCHLSLI